MGLELESAYHGELIGTTVRPLMFDLEKYWFLTNRQQVYTSLSQRVKDQDEFAGLNQSCTD